jgi:hypothetical protein
MITSIIEKYGLYVLTVLLLLTAGRLWWTESTLAAERLQHANELRKQGEERVRLLVQQETAFDAALAQERARRLLAQQQAAAIQKQLALVEDIDAPMAESIRLYLNWLLGNRAASAASVPTVAGRAASP